MKPKAIRTGNIGGGMPAKPAGEFGLKLYRARKNARLRQADVAQLVGVQPNTIARWERGQFLPLAIVQFAVLRVVSAQTK